MRLVFIIVVFCGYARSVEEFLSNSQTAQRDAEKKYEHLLKEDEHQYHIKVSESQAKFLFKFIDTDKNGLLDRNELITFGKLTISNDTESAKIWAGATLMEDKSGDKRLTFEEFYQPIVQYGVVQDKKKKDERHQHKEGHMHKYDPIREEL